MIWKQIRQWCLAGLVGAAFVGSAQAHFLRSKCCSSANECGAPAACAPAAPAAPAAAPAAPQTITVNTIEYVQEQRQVTRTVYKMEQRQETYTTCKIEHYTVPQTRTCMVNRLVTETVMETRNICERVPYWEEKTVMKERWVTQQVTEMKCKTVDRGHYETREVPASPSCLERLTARRHHGCCDPCAPQCQEACPRTKCVKCWVPNVVTEQCPVTHCKKVKVCEPCKVKVCCYKTVSKTVQVPVCKSHCVQEQKTVTVNVCCTRKVPVTCTRNVRVTVTFTPTAPMFTPLAGLAPGWGVPLIVKLFGTNVVPGGSWSVNTTLVPGTWPMFCSASV